MDKNENKKREKESDASNSTLSKQSNQSPRSSALYAVSPVEKNRLPAQSEGTAREIRI